MKNKTFARYLRSNMTDAEQLLWTQLRRKQLAGIKFRRQQGLGPYIVDFVCLSSRLIIEIDGGQHAEQADKDEQRTQWLQSQGFRVLRFWNNEVLGETEAVLEKIVAALKSPPP